MFRFQSLNVWEKSHLFTKEIFNLCDDFPSKFRYTLVPQLIKASLSITNNIAEGSGRSSKNDQNHFYSIARGSTLEVVNMLLLIKDMNSVDNKTINKLLSVGEEILKMLYSLRRNN
ncbi:MAG: four helix bundle protein [Candidatus Dojkabacteria bacterium]|nr:four helix bundle protein [Candidatus Dojkabacteria bacterium]